MKLPVPWKCIALAAILGFFQIVPAPAKAEDGGLHYSRGREFQERGKHGDAAEAFERVLNENPSHIMARYYLGLIYMRNVVTFERSEELLLEIPDIAMGLKEKPRDDIIFLAGLALARLYIKTGRNLEAIQLVQSVVSSSSSGSPLDEAYNILGLAYYYERLYGDAIFEFRRAIKLNPDNREARFNLKAIRARLEQFQAGKIYSRMGDREEAIAQFRKAIELDPRFVEARLRLGMELLADGNSVLALKELRRADNISAHYRKAFEIWYAQGLALKSLGMKDEAMKKFMKSIVGRPKFAAAYNEAGKILLDQGDYDAAATYFVKAIGIDPRIEYARNLQTTFARKGTEKTPVQVSPY